MSIQLDRSEARALAELWVITLAEPRVITLAELYPRALAELRARALAELSSDHLPRAVTGIVIVEILVAQGEHHRPLSDQVLLRKLDPGGVTMIDEALRKSAEQPSPLLRLPKQDHATVGAHPATVEGGLDAPLAEPFQLHLP